MRVLYAAYRHDPRDPDLSSGADYNFYTAIKQMGSEVKISLPSLGQNHFIERVLKRAHKIFLKKRYAKFPLTKVIRASRLTNRLERAWKPDVVFTMFPPTIVGYNGNAPCVYRLDTTFWGWQQEYPEFSRLGLWLSMWQERQAFAHPFRIITHSQWTKQILESKYGVSADRIVVFANPARLPIDATKEHIYKRPFSSPLQLLFVGKDYKRKGLSTALEVVRKLNAVGVASELTVCGGPKHSPQSRVRYVGYFRKSVPEEYERYLELYQKADLLLHPARFDPSPIVTSEAAAFGVPAITNANGGLATSVKDGVSGIVLPKWSPAEAYVATIKTLVSNPSRYLELRASTRRRYEEELSWEIRAGTLADILVQAHHSQS